MIEKSQVRKSTRSKPTSKEEYWVKELLKASENEAHLPIKLKETSPRKGRGVEATRKIEKDEFVVEYCGELVNSKEAKEREFVNDGNYLFFFKDHDQTFCIDATKEDFKFGRLINHSKLFANLMPKKIIIDNVPRLFFVAKDQIQPGEQLYYDYGDRRKGAMFDFPWLKQ